MDDDQKLFRLIDEEKYQVFLFVCPGSVPFNFASHPWFVVNKRGAISRWEVLFRKVKHETGWGHLYMNFFPPFQGVEIIPFYKKYFWKGELLGSVEGEVAKRMAQYIESAPTTYPYRETYFLSGPNSNTFVQWIFAHFPEFALALPRNSFGRNYKIKNLF